MSEKLNAEVISVYPNKVKISVDKLEDFKLADEALKVGSYLRISDNENAVLIAIIENFSIEVNDNGERKHLIEANPLGIISEGKFIRGGDSIAIPPKKVEPAKAEEIKKIYEQSIKKENSFTFSTLSSNHNIQIPVDGNKFFNKHIAIIGSTGSGKSHTLATIIQKAISEKKEGFTLNNSHIIVFDIHSEYKAAFPKANLIDINNLILPYWLLNSDELEEIFLESGDRNNYNQASVLRTVITLNKKKHNPSVSKIFFDSPLKFDIDEVIKCLMNIKSETRNSENPLTIQFVDGEKTFSNEDEKLEHYFLDIYSFKPTQRASKEKIGISKGTYADGTLDKFISRIQEKAKQDRLNFLFGKSSKEISFEKCLSNLIGYNNGQESNVTIIDLSGIPFEVLSITVSLISRLLFEYGYFYKRLLNRSSKNNSISNDVPLLLVYEEAHKYVPNSDLSKYRASKNSIERIAKEGRKYGVTLLLASQRPSEISETIFSQCNNFIAMRLTNPNDQNYVKKLLPDTLGDLINSMPAFKAGEGLLVGESIILPSIVQIEPCNNPPSSNDIPYWKLWKEEWKNLDFEKIKDEWYK